MGSNMSNDSRGISSIVSSSSIVVFQSSGCPYCVEAVKNLKSAGYEPTVIEASSDQRRELREVTSSGSVPSIWIKGKYVGGCNDGPEPWMGINKLLRNKKIDELLK